MIHQKKHRLRSLFCLALPAAAFLLLTSCGLRNDPEPISDTGKSSAAPILDEGENAAKEPENTPIPVAEFQYMKLSCTLEDFYTFNQKWLYFSSDVWEEGTGRYPCVYQNEICRDFKPAEFISGKDMGNVTLCALLADREGNCFTLWKDWGDDAIGTEPCFFMEKRSSDGIVRWHAEYAPDELDNRGEQLNQGTVAQDGRIYLYAPGSGGSAFVFDEEGALENICTPNLNSLDGIAAGPDGTVYGYCAAGSQTAFASLDGSEEIYVCPMIPVQVFDGREDGLYLSDGTSLWSYIPETAETKKMWDWEDEYVQIGAAMQYAGTPWQKMPIAGLFKSENAVTVLCMEQQGNDSSQLPVLTFASIAFQDRAEYPERQTITLGLPVPISQVRDSRHLEYLIRRYNRQSRKYKVEVADNENASVLVTKLLRGEGPDLIETSFLDAGNLAAGGALEDLTDYYDSSELSKSEDILPSVKNAGYIMGKNVLVMPAFYISSIVGEKSLADPEDWTVWNFLALGRENRMFHRQSPMDAFRYSMGIRKGERFIDYENMECHFDSPEFRRILEECLAWQTYDGNDPGDYMPIVINGEVVDRRILPLEEAHWLFEPDSILDNSWSEYLSYDENFLRKKVGYPGWEGAEYELRATDVFAMSSASLNKEGAWDFLEFLLSPELQDDIDWGFPARVHTLETRLANAGNSNGENAFHPSKEDIAALRRIADSAVYASATDAVWLILSEETQMFFAGDATLDATVEKIQNRIRLYLSELGR